MQIATFPQTKTIFEAPKDSLLKNDCVSFPEEPSPSYSTDYEKLLTSNFVSQVHTKFSQESRGILHYIDETSRQVAFHISQEFQSSDKFNVAVQTITADIGSQKGAFDRTPLQNREAAIDSLTCQCQKHFVKTYLDQSIQNTDPLISEGLRIGVLRNINEVSPNFKESIKREIRSKLT